MTLSVETPRVVYTGDGATTTFSYDFTLRQEPDLQVWLNGTIAGNYSVDLSAKSVTFHVEPAPGDVIELARVVDYEQTADYDAYDEFPAQTHETALDDLAIQIQQLAYRLGFTINYDPVGTLNPIWDAKGLRIGYVGDPANEQDAVNVRWLQASGNSPGLDGPPGEQGPPGFGAVVTSYTELRGITAPLAGQVVHVGADGIVGTFHYDDQETRPDNGGTIIAPSDGTPGAWVRYYLGNVQASWFEVKTSEDTAFDSGPAMQRCIDWAAGEPIYVDALDVYLGSTTLTCNTRTQIQGNDRRGTRFWTDQPNLMFKHARTDGLYTGQLNFRDCRFDGEGASEGVFIDSVNYTELRNFEIREVKGVKVNNCEDITWNGGGVFHSGDEYVTSDTGTISANSDQLAVTPSGASPDFAPNDFVTIAGAGEGGAPLETIVRTVVGNTITTAHQAVTQVTDAELTRGRAAIMFGDQLDDGTSGICNSIELFGQFTVERSRFHGLASFRSRSVKVVGCKFHGLTANDDPAAPAHDHIVLDRCEVPVISSNQFVHIRRSAIRVDQSGGTNESTFNIVGNQFDRPANYADGQDLKVVQILGGMGRVGENTFNDHLNHASYANFGVDVYLGANHLGVGGRNTHRGLPLATVQNLNPARSQPRHLRITSGGENRGGFIYNVVAVNAPGNPTGEVSDARFYRDGNQVHLSGSLTLPDLSGQSGNVNIEGLPFAADNALSSTTPSLVQVSVTGAVAPLQPTFGLILPGTTVIQLWVGDGSTASRLQYSALADGTAITFTGNYIAQN